MPKIRSLNAVEAEINAWITRSKAGFVAAYCGKDGKAWVVKYIAPLHLDSFLQTRQLVISTRAGFTWGDGVYLTPLAYPYSSIIYGRAGVMGWLDPSDTRRVYDAADPQGTGLYQEWIEYKPHLFGMLTTTVHSDMVNRVLRNLFRRRFQIDLVVFPPDQFNRAYVLPSRDRWFLLSDWSAYGPGGGGRPGFSRKVRECEWVAIVQEEFQAVHSAFYYQDLFGPHLTSPGVHRRAAGLPDITAQLHQFYQYNRARGAGPPRVLSLRP